MTVAVKTISFEKLIPNFKHFAGRKGSFRPVLEHVYNDGQHLIVTDSHRLLKINLDYISDVPFSEGEFYNPHTKEVKSSDAFNYPQVDRLIPTSYKTSGIINNVNQFKNNISDLKKENKNEETDKVTKGGSVVELQMSKDKAILGHYKLMNKLSYNIELETTGENLTVHFNDLYMKQALMAISKLNKLDNSSVDIGFNGGMRPIHIKKDEIFDIVVMPVRVGK